MDLHPRASMRIVSCLVILFASQSALALPFCSSKKNKPSRMLLIYPPTMPQYAYQPRQSPVPPLRSDYRAAPMPAYPRPVRPYPAPLLRR